MAGVEIGTAWVSLAVSAKGITKDVEKELKPVGDAAEDASKKAGDGFDKIGTKALAAAAVGGAALFGLASAAGDLEAAISANEQVLGDASQAVQDFARAGVENVGLSETAVLNAATSFGQLGKIMGLTGDDLSTFSTDLVTLSADLAAFANVPAAQALGDLQSAFAGQPEVMRKYGIFLDETTLKQAYFDETGVRVTGTLSAQQRLIATNSELWRQSGDIQGQAAREADSFARKLDDLKAIVSNVAADFGAPIVGFAASLLDEVGGGISQLSEWNAATGGMLATGVAASIGIATLSGAAVGVAAKVKGAVSAFKNLSGGMQLATGAVGALALGVTAGFAIYGLMTTKSREMAARTSEVRDALTDATAEAWEYADSLRASGVVIDGAEVAQRALSGALTAEGADAEKLSRSFRQLGLDTADTFSVLQDLKAGGEDMDAAFVAMAESAGLAGQDLEIVATAVATTDGNGEKLYDTLVTMALGMGQMTPEAAEAFADAMYPTATAMEEVQDQSEKVNLDDVATSFLAAAETAEGDLIPALLSEAEARAASNGVADSSIDTFTELQNVINEQSEADRQAAREALGLADAQGEAARTSLELERVSSSTVDMMSDAEKAFDDAASAADAFSDAFDRLIGVEVNMNEAQDNVRAGFDEMAEVAWKAAEGVDGYTTSIDMSTEEGRENRAMIRDQIGEITSLGEAMLDAGYSVDETAAGMNQLRDELIAQLVPFAGSTQAAENYVNMLGLTPESIDTAVNFYNDDVAKRKVEDYLDELGEIPPEVATRVSAYIDQGDYAAALAQLNLLTAPRSVLVNVRGPGVSSNRNQGYVPQAAHGWYGDSPTYAEIGHGPEWVAPLSKPAEMERWLTDPKIRNPILQALNLDDIEPVMAGGRGGPLVGEMNVYESRGESVEAQLERVSFRAKHGLVGV